MDKYQSSLISHGTFSLVAPQGNGTAVITGDCLTITQNENYEIVRYVLRLENNTVASVKVDNDRLAPKNDCIEIPIDFANQIAFIEVFFKNDFAEPCKIAIKYVLADKNSFDEKVYAEKQTMYKETMHFICRTGLNLVNLHWQNACDEVAITEIRFFADDSKMLMLIEKIELPSDRFFYAVTNLAYGQYSATITQKDVSGKTIITDKATMQLNDPFADMTKNLNNQLSGVGALVAASGRHQVVR